MSDASIAITILWIFLFIYSIGGSIDFGAGFWAMVYGKRENTKAASIANRYLSPSWEVTNVFLVLLVVALVGFFPRAAFLLGTLLLLPVGLVLFLLTIRSTFMVYAYSVQKYQGVLRIVSGTTGLLIPGLLVSVLPITLGGFIQMEEGHYELLFWKLFQTPTGYAHIGFGLTTELFLSALFLADYAREAEDEASYMEYRRNAISLGPITLGMAVLATITMIPEARWIVENMRKQWLWFALSLAAFVVGYSALWWKQTGGKAGRPRMAVIFVVIQYALASIAYGTAHMPYIVYPYLTIDQGITNHTMFQSLLVGYTITSLLLLPLFIWFWLLFMKDKRYLKQE